MNMWRRPFLPIALLLVLIGAGNWYTGWSKIREYDELVATTQPAVDASDFDEFARLTPRTNASLLRPLHRGPDAYTIVAAKLDFYRIVRTGGRVLIVVGLLVALAGAASTWYRRRQTLETAH